MSKRIFLFDSIGTEDKFMVHTHIAKTLSKKIVSLKSEKEPINIGVFGEWGSGKSFIVKKVEENLNDGDIAFYEFDAWKFNGKSLERSILFTLEEQAFCTKDIFYHFDGMTLKQKLDSKIKVDSEIKIDFNDIKSKFTEVSKFIVTPFIVLLIINIVLSVIGKWDFINMISNNMHIKSIVNIINNNSWIEVAWGSLMAISTTIAVPTIIIKALSGKIEDFLKVILLRKEDVKEEILPTFSSDEFEKIFRNMISKIIEINKISKVVIVFDNIDRCEPKFAYEIITTIKTYMNLENCIYIIPCDDEALKNYLAYKNENTSDRNYEQEFLDKFFQVSVRIPKLSSENIDRYIEDSLNELELEHLGDQEKRIIRQILYYAYENQTPRKIKRFINDFAVYYSLAHEIDPKKEFILNDIEMFTIIVAIKQRWPLFENYLLEDIDFRNKFYVGNTKSLELVNKEFGNELFIFLNNIKSIFYNDKPMYSYIYIMKHDNEVETLSKIKNGDVIELNSQNYDVLMNSYKLFIQKNDQLYLYNFYKCLINSLKGSNADKYKETEYIFNSFTHRIYESKELKEGKAIYKLLDIYNFFNNEIKDNFTFVEKISFDSKTFGCIQNILLDYLEYSINQDTIKSESIFDNIMKIKKIINSEYLERYYNICIQNSLCTTSEFCNKIRHSYPKITNFINEKIAKDIILRCLENDEINDDSLAAIEFIINESKKNPVVIEYINNNKDILFTLEGMTTQNKFIRNLGLILTRLVDSTEIEKYKDFVEQIIISIKNEYIVDTNIIIKYYGVYTRWINEDLEIIFRANVLNRVQFDVFLEESIKLFGQEYFIKQIYNNGIKSNVKENNLKIMLDSIDIKLVIKYFDNIVLDPIYANEIMYLSDRISQLENKKSYLTKKITKGISYVYDEVNSQDKKHQVSELIGAFNYLKENNLIINDIFSKHELQIIKLYINYPQQIKDLLYYSLDNRIFKSDSLLPVINAIIDRLKEDRTIEEFSSLGDILEACNEKWDSHLNNCIESMLKELLKLGREKYVYEIAYNIIKVYAKYYDITKFSIMIQDLINRGDEKFNNLLEKI